MSIIDPFSGSIPNSSDPNITPIYPDPLLTPTDTDEGDEGSQPTNLTHYLGWITHPDNPVKLSTTVLAASSAETEYPASRMVLLPTTHGWRSTTVASQQTITVDFGAAQSVDVIALVNHNLTSAAEVHVQAGSTLSYGDFDVVMDWREFLMFYSRAETVSYQYWRVTISDPANPDGYFHVGYLMIGPLVRPTFNFRHGWVTTPEFVNQEISSPCGVHNVAEMYFRQRLGLEFGPLTAAQMDVLRTMYLTVRKSKYPLLLLPHLNENTGYFVRIQNMLDERIELYRYALLQMAEDSYGDRRAA